MIKKIIYILTILIAFMISSLSYTFITEIDSCNIGAIPDYITIQEKKNVAYFYLNFDGDIRQGVNKLLKYCQDNNQSMVMIHSYNDAGTTYINWYLLSQNANDLKGLKVDKRKDINFSKYDKKEYYTTDTNDNKSMGKLVNIDPDYYNDAPYQYSLYNMNGIEEVIKNNNNQIALQLYSNNKEALVNDMSEIFKEANMTYRDVTEGYAPAQIESVSNEEGNKVKKLLIISSVLIVLLLILYVLRLKRTIMIKRLNGLSILKIMQSEFLVFFISEVFIFTISLLGFMYLKTGAITIFNINYYNLFIPYTLLFIVLLLLFFVIIYISIYYTTHLKYLKTQYKIRDFLQFNAVIKIIIICLLITPLTSLITDMKDNFIEYRVFRNNKDTIENLAYIDSNLFLPSKTELVFNYLNENGGIYIDFQTYANNTTKALHEILEDVDEEDIKEIAIDYPYIFANANYLKEHHLKDENGKMINLSKYKDDIILVPQQYKNEDIQKIMFGRNLKIVYIQNSDEYMNYQLTEPYYLSNPVIRLVTHKTDDSDLTNMNIDIHNKSIKAYQEELRKLSGETVCVNKYSSLINYMIRTMKNNLMEIIFTLGIYIIFIIIFVFQLIYLYLNENQMRYSLQYMFGFDFMERYQDFISCTFITYIIVFIVGILILRIKFIPLMIFVLMSLMFELIVQLLSIKRFENKNIANILKGEVY